MTILPIADGEDGVDVRDKLNAMIGEVGAFTSAFGGTYFVSPSGNPANSGTGPGPEAAWPGLSQVNAASLPAGTTVLFEGGQFHLGTLNPPGSDLTFGSYGTGDAIVGYARDITDGPWTDDTATLPGTWYTDITSTLTPVRCEFTAPWLEGDRLGHITKSPAAAGTDADVSVNILGVSGDWTQLRQNLWQRAAFTFTTVPPRHPTWLSLNGATPKQGKLYAGDCVAEGDFWTTSTSLVLYSPAGNPATVYSSIRASGAWRATTVSGTTRRIRVFSPGGNPATEFTQIICATPQSAAALSLLAGQHRCKFKNIRFLGGDPVVSTGDTTDIQFEDCEIRLSNSRGIRLETGCHRWTFIGGRIGDNGAQGSQDGHGLQIGDESPDEVLDTSVIGTEISFNGSDGVVGQCYSGSHPTFIGCRIMHNGENAIDMKARENLNIQDSLILSSIMSTGSGTQAFTIQVHQKIRARRTVIVGTSGSFSPTATGRFALTSDARAEFDLDSCIIAGTHADQVAIGDGGPGPAAVPAGVFRARACLIVAMREVNNSRAITLSAGDMDLQQCTIISRGAGSGGETIRQSPGSGFSLSSTITKQISKVKNSILYNNCTGTSAYLYERFVTALNNVTAELVNNIYHHEANPTNWMHGGDGNAYTAAQIDADIAQTGFTVTSLIADPTADPMFDNPHEGGQRIVTSDLRGIGNWAIGGTLIHLTCSAISSSPNAPNLGEKVTNGTGVGYIRNIFSNGLLLSNVTGTFTTGALTGQWGGNIATVSAVSAALTLKAGVWDAQTVNFSTLGQVVTGSGLGHTGILVSQVDAGAAGRMVLAVASGITFQDNDVVTGATEGSCTFDGVLRSSPARRSATSLYPIISRGAPRIEDGITVPVALGDEFETFSANASGSDTFSVVNATKTWTQSSASTTWASRGTRSGLKFYTNTFHPATIDIGGPYTVDTVDSDVQFKTLESPGADVTNSSSANFYRAGDDDHGCYPIP